VWLGFIALGVGSSLLVPTYSTLASLTVDGHQLAISHTTGFSLAAFAAGSLLQPEPATPLLAVAAIGMLIATLPFVSIARRRQTSNG